MTDNQRETYYWDRAKNLIRWDKFYVADENWSRKRHRENVTGHSENVVLEACEYYLLEMKDCTEVKGKKLMMVLVDPLSGDVPHLLLVAAIHVEPEEPIFIKHRRNYNEGILEVIQLLDRKKEECENDKQRSEMKALIETVAGILAKEQGYKPDDE